jgi:Protein of unknown function (DUF5131)
MLVRCRRLRVPSTSRVLRRSCRVLPLRSCRGVRRLADGSSIEWTEATWNPTTGCDRISAGCDHCYALTLSKRLKAMGAPKYQNDGDPRTSGPGFGITVHPDALTLPYAWRAPRLVFVNSMSDLFHARVPLAFVRQVFDVMRDTPQHTYQVWGRLGCVRKVWVRWFGDWWVQGHGPNRPELTDAQWALLEALVPPSGPRPVGPTRTTAKSSRR